MVEQIRALLAGVPEGDAARVPVYNALTRALRDFVGMSEPCLAPQLVPAAEVHGNAYNPNVVAPPEMKLLHLSIQQDGVTMCIVGYAVPEGGTEIVDGFHRSQVCKGEARDGRKMASWQDVAARLRGYLPISYIDKPADERQASTIRHNRARGKHGVGQMSEIVQDLFFNAGWSDTRIAEHLGMEPDEVLRLRQIGGLADLFAAEEFSEAWEPA